MKELLNSINSTISDSSLSYRLLSDDESQQIFEELKDRFEFDYSELFVWDGSKYIFSKLSYDEDWEDSLLEALSTFTNQIYLIVSAEEYYPWKIYHGDKDEILKLLEEQIYFEYFIADLQLESILVDTHDNELIKLKHHCKN